MTKTAMEILSMENPYLELNTIPKLMEHIGELNTLTLGDKKRVAIRLLNSWPKEELINFEGLFGIPEEGRSESSNFLSILSTAFKFKMLVIKTQDPTNPEPHLIFTAPQFNADLYRGYSILFEDLNQYTNELAIRLTFSTPPAQRNLLMTNHRALFPGPSRFREQVGAAFTLYKDVGSLLLSQSPEQFFSSRDFSIDICVEFFPLLLPSLQAHAQTIGERLAATNEQTRSNVEKKLARLITHLPPEGIDPLTLILSIMNKSQTQAVAGAAADVQVNDQPPAEAAGHSPTSRRTTGFFSESNPYNPYQGYTKGAPADALAPGEQTLTHRRREEPAADTSASGTNNPARESYAYFCCPSWF